MLSFTEFLQEQLRTKERALDLGDRFAKVSKRAWDKEPNGFYANRMRTSGEPNHKLHPDYKAGREKGDVGWKAYRTKAERGREVFSGEKNVQKVKISDLTYTQGHTGWDREKAKAKLDDKEPINVLHHDGKHYVIDGHHRVMARRLLGHKDIDADVRSIKENDDYKGAHQAPGPGSGAPMHDLKGVYPDDFHGHNGFRYYSDTGNHYDRATHDRVASKKGKPDEMVWIHRAVPTEVHKAAMKQKDVAPIRHMIKRGDWVTPSKEYAKEHGESNLGGKGKYKIASMRVPAKHLYTDGNSIHEWGYHPDEEKK